MEAGTRIHGSTRKAPLALFTEIEQPLLKAVMDYTGGNQSQAADILGMNRGTLRKKLRSYQLID